MYENCCKTRPGGLKLFKIFLKSKSLNELEKEDDFPVVQYNLTIPIKKGAKIPILSQGDPTWVIKIHFSSN